MWQKLWQVAEFIGVLEMSSLATQFYLHSSHATQAILTHNFLHLQTSKSRQTSTITHFNVQTPRSKKWDAVQGVEGGHSLMAPVTSPHGKLAK